MASPVATKTHLALPPPAAAMDKLSGFQSNQKVQSPLEIQYLYSHHITPLNFTRMPGKHPAQGVRTFLLWRAHTIEIRLPALTATGVRAPWALTSLNGPDEPHLGPPPTPSAHGWEVYLSSGLGLCSLLELCCRCTCSGLALPGFGPS